MSDNKITGAIHKQDGVMIYDQCPACKARLMQNAIGNQWCSNLMCDYHIRDGRRAIMPRPKFPISQYIEGSL